MLNITKEQVDYLKLYLEPELVDKYIEDDDIGNLLIDYDDAIIELGMDKTQEITHKGIEMQKIYDQIYNQNC